MVTETMRTLLILAFLLWIPTRAQAQHEHAMTAGACDQMEAWDYDMGMCMPIPMTGMPMSMIMVHANAFATYVTEQGPRGRSVFATPNMFMIDAGTSIGNHHYFNLD